jgi:hypothetical protein
MTNIRSNIDKMVSRRLTMYAAVFAIRHPFTNFDTKAARRAIHRRITKRMGCSLWVPHQGAQEKARRIRQGRAPFEYNQTDEQRLARSHRRYWKPNFSLGTRLGSQHYQRQLLGTLKGCTEKTKFLMSPRCHGRRVR